MQGDIDTLTEISDAMLAALEGAEAKTSPDGTIKSSLNPDFAKEYDAWDGKTHRKPFLLGRTSQALKYVGVKDQSIIWDASKIAKIKRDHPAMTDEIIKQVPQIIENPILVMESKTEMGRVTMFGELFDADGFPVLAVLELNPTSKQENELNLIKVASAYGKDTNPQRLINESRMLYVESDKEKTHAWLKLSRLQLPLSARYGLNGRISYSKSSVKDSIRDSNEKSTRYSIKEGMTEEQRYEELKDATLNVAVYEDENSKLTRAEVDRLERATRRDARRYVKTLYEKFGVAKHYTNKSADIEFEFGDSGFSKSVHEQTSRGAGYASFGKMLSCFDSIIENAIPIEIHGDKYVQTKRADKDLQRVYVLVSGYQDDGMVPIQLEVKEFVEKDNSLYVAIALNKIKDAVLATKSVSTDTPARAVRISNISLREMFANINPSDGEFLKYVPDGFLNMEQKAAKTAALARERRKIEGLKFSIKDLPTVNEDAIRIEQLEKTVEDLKSQFELTRGFIHEPIYDSLEMISKCGLDMESVNIPGYGNMNRPAIPETKKGWKIIETLEDYLLNNGVEIYLNTPASELVSSDGVVTGVVCDTQNGKKTFNAKAVVLATGGYHRIDELMNEFVPIAADNYTASAIGNTGDGMLMARSVDAAMYKEQTVFGGYFIFNPKDVLRGGYAYSDTLANSLFVSQYGDRRYKENGHGYSMTAMYNIYHEPTFVWSVMDSDIVDQMVIKTDYYTIEAADIIENKDGLYEIVSADTLPELAVKMGVVPTLFVENVNRYNELCAQGEDVDMGKKAELLEAIDNGPFYAIKGYAIDRSTVGGIVSNIKAEVCGEDGNVIPGLYAAGDVSNRAFYSGAYYGGSGLCVASTRGYLAGMNSSEYAANK